MSGQTWSQVAKMISENAKKRGLPLTLQMELTGRCNLKCKMCYVSKNANDREAMSGELTGEQWLKIATQARDAGVYFVLITGGEPVLHKDFWQIFDGLKQLGVTVTLNTNATTITPEIARRLGQNPPNKVVVTLYGSCREEYAALCGDPDGFEKAIRGIDLLIKEGLLVNIRTTVTKYNRDAFTWMVDFAKARKVTLSYVNYIAPRRVGCGADSACDPLDARLSPKDIIQYERDVHEFNIKSKLEEAKAYGYTDEEYEKKRAENIEKNRLAAEAEDGVFDPADSNAGSDKEEKFKRKGAFSCAGGLTAFWVTFDGKMTPCGLVDVLYSKPLEVGFSEAARQLREACEETPTCQECKTCELRRFCMVCPARVYLETGSFEKCPDYLKESARERRDLRLKGLW